MATIIHNVLVYTAVQAQSQELFHANYSQVLLHNLLLFHE